MQNIIKITLLLFIITSCQKESTNEVPFTEAFGISDYMTAKEQLKTYALWGAYTDGLIDISLKKSLDSQTAGEIFAKYREDPMSDRSNGGDFYINNIKYIHNGNKYVAEDSSIPGNPFELGEYIKETILGKETNFKLIRREKTIYDETMYLPNEIEILNFTHSGIRDQTTYHEISRSNFSIEWNADTENANGIIALVIWDGNLISTNINELAGGSYHYKASWLNDTGSGNLPSSLFAGVPKDAVFTLMLMRGNFKVIEGSESGSYKLSVLSDDRRNCLLTD